MSNFENENPGAPASATGARMPTNASAGVHIIRKSKLESQWVASDWYVFIPDDGRKPVVVVVDRSAWAIEALAKAGPKGLDVSHYPFERSKANGPVLPCLRSCVQSLKKKGVHIATVRDEFSDRYVLEAAVVKGGAQ